MSGSSAVRICTVALLISLPPLGCTESQAPNAMPVSERTVTPHVVNAAVTNWNDAHFVWLGSDTSSSTQIMLLLSGSNGRPANFRLIGRTAARQGYRTIGLMYPDDIAVVNACASDPDDACMELMRREIITGSALSAHVAVGRDDSIDGRLADLLRYLVQHYPDEQWQSFLTADGSPRWDRIAVGGLSQGGGHAAYIAKLRAVPRVVMFGAPADGYDGQVAPWMQIGATPSERYYGFRHQRDPFASITPNWLALGLDSFGPVVDVTTKTTSFGTSHMLTTDILPATGSYDAAHPSVFGDGPTPKRSDGSPVFLAAWRYLLGAPTL